MNINFVPAACTGENPKITGSLIIRLPSAEERCDIIADSNMDLEAMKSNEISFYKSLSSVIKKVYDHIVKVDLKRAGNDKVLTVEEMKYDPDCFPILAEIANKLLIGGFVLGKS